MTKPTSPSRIAALIAFLGLRSSIVGVLAMAILVGMGEHMAEQFLPLYLIALGGGFISVGSLNGMDNLLGALYSFPGGYLADRIGTKRALLVFNLVSMAGFIIVILVPSWPAVICAAALFLSWTAISAPATMSLVAKVLPKDKRTMGVTMHSLVRRVPMALGPMAGGGLIHHFGLQQGIRWAFIGALALAVVAAVLQQVLIEDDRPDRAAGAKKTEGRPWRMWKFVSPELRRLLVADVLIRFCEQVPYAFVVVWAVGTAAKPGPVNEFEFGILRTVEMATAILVYLPVAYLADRGNKKPYVIITFVFFTLFPLVLYFSHSFALLILAFILRGLKEFGEPTRKAMIVDFAPDEAKAGVYGLYYLIRDSIVSLAAFGGALLWSVSPELNLFTAFGFGILGTLWFAVRGKDLGRSSSTPDGPGFVPEGPVS
jgi:MFS family permease